MFHDDVAGWPHPGQQLARSHRARDLRGAFLNAGLIDELILLMMPIGDGSLGTPTLFDTEEGYTRRTVQHFRLESAKPVKDGALLLHYAAKR